MTKPFLLSNFWGRHMCPFTFLSKSKHKKFLPLFKAISSTLCGKNSGTKQA